MKRSLAISLKVYFGLMAYLATVKLVLTLLPQVFRSPTQAAAFEWKFLAVWTVLGLLGVFLVDKTGFPAAWGESISVRERLVFPAVFGFLLWGGGDHYRARHWLDKNRRGTDASSLDPH